MNYRRVSKHVARKMYNRSFTIKLFPCKVNGKAVLEDPHYLGFTPPHTISLETSKQVDNWFERDVSVF